MTPRAIYLNIRGFILRWKDNIPAEKDPRALDMLSDFALCMGAEFHIRLVEKKPEEKQQ